MIEVLTNSLPIFITILVVLLYRSQKKLPKNFSSSITFLTFQIVVPFLLFQVLTQADFSQLNSNLIVFTTILTVALLVTGKFLSNTLGKNRKQKTVLQYSQFDFYVYGFAMPFILVNFSNQIITKIVIADIIVFISYLFIGSFIAAHYSNQKVQMKQLIADNLLKSVFFWTIVISIGINLANITVPDGVYQVASFFSTSFGLLVAVIIGSSLTLPKFDAIKDHIIAYSTRIIAVLAIVLSATFLLSFNQLDQVALLLTFLTPIGSFGILFASKYHADEDYMAQLHLTSYTLSLFLYPLLIVWIKSFFSIN